MYAIRSYYVRRVYHAVNDVEVIAFHRTNTRQDHGILDAVLFHRLTQGQKNVFVGIEPYKEEALVGIAKAIHWKPLRQAPIT